LGTEFYLGSGVFAGAGVDELAKTHPETAALPKGRGKGLCPSHPTSRQLMAEYLTEMYDTFPEADGMLLEIRDDHGESEISFLREFSQTLWRRHSRAKIVCTIGRSEHKGDAGLYRAVQSLSDPRFAWLVVGGNWELPGEKGQAKPLTHFSPNMIHWKQAYCASLDDLRQWIGRVAREGVLGCCAALDPEFAGDAAFTAAEAVPCAVTRLAYRELCWAPQLGLDRLREIIHERFFGADSSPDLTTALLFLFDLIREQGVKGAHVQKAAAATQLDRIEAILGRHPSEFRPKARRALPLLREALAGARQALCQSQSALEGVRGVTNPRGPRGRTS
jgi:hypothetical protein